MKLLSILALSIFATVAASASALGQPTGPHGPCTTVNAQNECIGWAVTAAPSVPYQQQYVPVPVMCPYGTVPALNLFGPSTFCTPVYYGYGGGFGLRVRIGGGRRR